jgi:hypothetical protein
MSKTLGTMAAFALLATLARPGSATAAERRADGLQANQPGAETEFSSYHRRWHRPYRYGYYRPWRSGYGYYRPYYRPYYAGYPYAYGYGYPYYRPGISIGFGFGPRWGW